MASAISLVRIAPDAPTSAPAMMRPVLSMTKQALPNTLELAVLAILIGLLLGVPGGVFAASRPGRLRDSSTQFVSLFALSVPAFLLATVLATWLFERPLLRELGGYLRREEPGPPAATLRS